MAPVTVLYRQELPRRAQTLVLQSHHGPGLPLGHAGISVTLALPHAGQRLCPDRKHTPGVTTGGVPLGLEQRQHRAEAGAGGVGQQFCFFLPSQLFLVHGFSSSPLPVNPPLVLSCFLFLFLQQGRWWRAHPQASLARGDVRGKGKNWFDHGCYHIMTLLYKPALSSAFSSPFSWGVRADTYFQLKM